MRIYELAKRWNLDNKELVTKLKSLGYKIKNHMSSLDEDLVERVERKLFPQKSEPKSKETAKPSVPQQKKTSETKPPQPGASHVKEVKTSKVKVPAAEPQRTVLKGLEAEIDKKIFEVEFPITVTSLAQVIDIPVNTVIKNLMSIGVFANVNQLLSQEIVMKFADKTGLQIKKLPSKEDQELGAQQKPDDESKLVLRPPVVTMMGHVDHGKTSLLDAIRSSNVVDREAGKITQHIGAYGVDIPGKGHVTFVDTPGHEAFSAMRARGANVTDVVVLVVAADDGIMPQTIEAINHAKAAEVTIVVAVNKCDLPAANPTQVMSQLQSYDLAPEEWGGKTIVVNVSAKTGEGIEKLLEMLLLESEILELKANPDKRAVGTVLEGQISKGRGIVTDVIVQEGTLKTGDFIVCGLYYGKVRAMHNDRGKTVKTAGPSYAVEILGLNGVPNAGDKFFAVADEKIAREISEKRQLERREQDLLGQAGKHTTLDSLHTKMESGEANELKLIIKGDVQGSIEALKTSLEKLSNDKIRLRVIHGAVGGINESDAMLATASDAVIIGFHVKADLRAQELIEREQIDVRFYSIIYEAVEDVKKAMEGLLAPTFKEVIVGNAEVRDIFKISRIGTIPGSHVLKGKIQRNTKVRLIRDNIVIFDGRLSSLKRFKDDAKEVAEGYDCGLSFERFNDVKVNDRVEAYRIEETAQTL